MEGMRDAADQEGPEENRLHKEREREIESERERGGGGGRER